MNEWLKSKVSILTSDVQIGVKDKEKQHINLTMLMLQKLKRQ